MQQLHISTCIFTLAIVVSLVLPTVNHCTYQQWLLTWNTSSYYFMAGALLSSLSLAPLLYIFCQLVQTPGDFDYVPDNGQFWWFPVCQCHMVSSRGSAVPGPFVWLTWALEASLPSFSPSLSCGWCEWAESTAIVLWFSDLSIGSLAEGLTCSVNCVYWY